MGRWEEVEKECRLNDMGKRGEERRGDEGESS